MPQETPKDSLGRWSVPVAGCPMAEDRWQAVRGALQLTPRELQIVRSLFEGLKEDTIAGTLGVSRCTVHTHLGRLYRKLQVDSCSGLLLRAFREFLSDDHSFRASMAAPASARRARLARRG